MTVERAAFYRLLLSVGLSDRYQADIALALEEEAPLSDLLLDLAFCLSDVNRTISVLDRYIGGRTPDENSIHAMVLAELQDMYVDEAVTLQQAAELLFTLIGSRIFDPPWDRWQELIYDYDMALEGWGDMDVVLDDFFIELFAPEEGEEEYHA